MAKQVVRRATRTDTDTEWYLAGEPPTAVELELLPVYGELEDIPVMLPEQRLWYHPLADMR